MKYIPVLLLFLVSTLLNAQDQPTYTPLQSSKANSALSDLETLSPYFKYMRLVGMGESTHGTSEFFTMRHKFFRYLVEKHGFNTFFLEADYANCLPIDHYIKTGKGDAGELVADLGLWPWKTYEMVDLVKWMKDYNDKNQDHMLNFIGCDMQKFQSTVEALDNIVRTYDPNLIDTIGYEDLFATTFETLQNVEVIEKMEKLRTEKATLLESVPFGEQDRMKYSTLIRHLSQALEDRRKADHFSFRDVKMAENILYHMNSDTSIKGFFWAHNLHVFNIYHEHRKEEKAYKRAGGMLKKELGSQYYVIAQEFDQGNLNAYQIIDMDGDVGDKNNYELKPVTVKASAEGTFGSYFRSTEDDILFIPKETLSQKKVKYLKMHDIGATYTASKTDPDQVAYFSSCNGCFDALLLIKNTTATRLLIDDNQ